MNLGDNRMPKGIEPLDIEMIDEIAPPPTNVKGLPPARAELAKLVAWRKDVSDELDKLLAGRRDVGDHIARLEREEAKASAAAKSSANSVVEAVKRGRKWAIAPSAPVSNSAELEIARNALATLDGERAAGEALVQSIDRRISSAIDGALLEYASAPLRDEYRQAVEQLHTCMVKINSLHRVRGFRAMDVVDLPRFDSYAPPRRIGSVAVDEACKVWVQVAAAWKNDPRAEPKLTFAPYDAYAREPVRVEDTGPTAATIITGINPRSIECHKDD